MSSQSPEVLIVALARTGDRDAFAELVRRRQSGIRSLMRRCCADATLAEDLSQQVFLQAWKDIPRLRQPKLFPGWLKRLAINIWRQHLRKNDALRNAGEYQDGGAASNMASGLDLDRGLAALPDMERLCLVLAYQEGMTHPEISKLTDLPLGTVKSHIRRGGQRLQHLLADYQQPRRGETQ